MSKKTRYSAVAVTASIAAIAAGCSASTAPQSDAPVSSTSFTSEELTDGKTSFIRVTNPSGGATLSFSKDGGMSVIEVEDSGSTFAFKDMNGNKELDVYEDWRKPAEERAADLVTRLSKEQMAGLMLFSGHERAPGDGLTDDQKKYLSESHLRAVLNAGPSAVKDNVQWVNEMQAYVETLVTDTTPYLPVNYSSDPRSDATDSGAFSPEGEISKWPSSLGLAATFQPELVQKFGQMASEEYRALGIGTALSPQIDLATEPRWLRASGTFGENSDMAGQMAKAYVDGFQNSFTNGEPSGWGATSVNAMIKHWPGDGAGEGGRESHTDVGKFAAFSSNNMDEHMSVFKQALDATAVMTSYSIAVNKDGEAAFSTLTGTSYDPARLAALRKDNSYNGVVVTDWGVTSGGKTNPDARFGMAWGVSDLTVEQRHFEVLKNGTDMFGGNNAVAPVLAAYDMWEEAFKKGGLPIDAQTRFQESAARIVRLNFLNGVYDNPFLSLEESQAAVGSSEKIEAGRQAQLDSIVMLKNAGETIKVGSIADFKNKKAYIPQSHDFGFDGIFGPASYSYGPTLDIDVAKTYFKDVVTDEVKLDGDEKVTEYTAPSLADVDVVVVGMDTPNNGNPFTSAGFNKETKEYYPLTLQYRTYTADGDNVRKVSLGGDIREDGSKENRSYFGKQSKISNEADLDAFERAVAAVKASGRDIPIIVVLKAKNPVIPAEFEKEAQAIIVGFGTSDEALLQVALGGHEPQGRLPMAFPKDMDTVEGNFEDKSGDYTAYTDSAGNVYDYGFGLNSQGVIK